MSDYRIAALLVVLVLAGCGGSGVGGAASDNGAVPSAIEIAPVDLLVAKNTDLQFKATGTFSDNTVRDVTALVTWKSSNEAVATISGAAGSWGLAKSIVAGTAIVTASMGGIAASTTLTVSETPQATVTGIGAVAGDGQVSLSWTPAAGATKYDIYWSTTPGTAKATGTKIPGITETSYIHAGLANGTSYYYVITADTSAGESDDSPEVVAAPSGSISVGIVQPSRGSLAGKVLKVVVTDTAKFQLAGISAKVEDRQVGLVFSATAACSRFSCGPGWAGTISLDGLAKGAKLLTVTAVDVFGNSVTSSNSFTYDQRPTLVVSEPLSYSVARPQLHIAASCIDDQGSGCQSLTVTIDSPGGTAIASGQDLIDQTVSLASRDGTSVVLNFQAMDSAGQVTSESRVVLVETSTKFVEAASVKGNIWDAQPDRILYLDTSTGGNILTIRDRSSGADTVVMDEAGKIPQYGFLTPKGAIFVEQSGDATTARLYDWSDGQLSELGAVNSTVSLKAKGDYAIWSQGPSGSQLVLRNLVTGVSTTIAADAGNVNNDVSPNGDVVYGGASFQVFRYRAGVTTQLTNHDDTVWSVAPLTDGQDVVYQRRTPCCTNQAYALVMSTASGEVSLTAAGAYEPTPSLDYQLEAGRAAFTATGSDGVRQVWLRSAAGNLTQVSFLGTSSRINALGSNGDITWSSGTRLYLTPLGAMPVEIGSSLGRTFYQGGKWQAIVGRSLFDIVN